MLKRMIMVAAVAVLVLALAMVSTASAGVPIPTAGITATSKTWYSNMEAYRAVNGAGLTGIYPNETHDQDHGNQWCNDGSPAVDEWFKVDLGASYPLETLRVWNWNYHADPWIGVYQVDIYHSNQAGDPGEPGVGANWILLGTAGTQHFTEAVASGALAVTDEIALGGIVARWVGLDINSIQPGAGYEYVALAELQFVEVPEPASAVLLVLGLPALIWRRRKK